MKLLKLTFFIITFWTLQPSAWGGNGATSPNPVDSQQKLDFEDELIEGMNKRPYDSLSQLSDKNKQKRDSHLYWMRTHFHPENQGTLRELRFVQ